MMTNHNHNYSAFATDDQYLKLKTMIGKETDVMLSPSHRAVLVSVDPDYVTWRDAKGTETWTHRTDWAWNCFFSTWMVGVHKNYVPYNKDLNQ